MGGVCVDVDDLGRGEGGISDQAGEEDDGSATQKCRQIDPIEGFKPVHVLNSVLPTVGSHGVEGINTNGR